jgi:hypothetical protein
MLVTIYSVLEGSQYKLAEFLGIEFHGIHITDCRVDKQTADRPNDGQKGAAKPRGSFLELILVRGQKRLSNIKRNA